MDLSVRDVARLFKVSENTVYRWIRSGSLPAQRVQDQYRFNRVELQEWATLHHHPVSPELSSSGSGELPSLHWALERGGIYYQIPGERREAVLKSVAELPGIPASVNRQMLYQLLVAREALASTALGNGIAIPHPRDPVVVQENDPFVLLCFLQQPVDFSAMDGQPVRVLFTVLSPSVRSHLQMLAKLAFALHDTDFKELLRTMAPRETILERARLIEGAPPQEQRGK
jgi:PTS system nitrogen regulatory IIA component